MRLIYDDPGCFLLLPKDFCEQMAEAGIECVAFNRFRPILTVTQNNRNHQKIMSIDGIVAFTGGVNLADEYINAIEKHGYWKDSGIEVTGKAACLRWSEVRCDCSGRRPCKDFDPLPALQDASVSGSWCDCSRICRPWCRAWP